MTAQEQEHLFKDWLEQYKGLFFKIVRTYAVTAMDMDDLFQEIVIQETALRRLHLDLSYSHQYGS
jgi:RNA polymerase sigma-70 factor, ECF subfamily